MPQPAAGCWAVRSRRVASGTRCVPHIATGTGCVPSLFCRARETHHNPYETARFTHPTRYRRNEIGSITRQSFDSQSDPPTLTVDTGHSKHRRRDVLPLRRDFAEQIQAWLDSRERLQAEQPLLNVTDKRTAEMIQKDLKRAGIPYVEERGHYADFHALRKTFITNLCCAGVYPKLAQMLARHLDINLTMNIYTMLGVYDQAMAVGALPPIPKMAGAANGHSVDMTRSV